MGTESPLPNEHLSNVPQGAVALPCAGLPVETMALNKNLKALAPAFRSIEEQLRQTFPEALAKLRDPDLDFTRAQIEVRGRGGKSTSPAVKQLSDFVIIDFARSCAEELGQGGQVFVTIDPNDGKSQRFSLGFVAPQVEISPEQQERGLRGEINELKQMIARQQQLALLGGGGNSQQSHAEMRKQLLDEMRVMKEIFAPSHAAGADQNNMAGQMKDMASAMGQMVGSAVNMVKEIGTAGQALNPAAGEAAKAQAWLGVAKEGLPLVREAVVAVKELTVKPPVGMTDAAKQALVGVA